MLMRRWLGSKGLFFHKRDGCNDGIGNGRLFLAPPPTNKHNNPSLSAFLCRFFPFNAYPDLWLRLFRKSESDTGGFDLLTLKSFLFVVLMIRSLFNGELKLAEN
ncbi:hypothetical protein Ancab_025524 [Ancistrocladus abbreviatus]